MGKSRAVAGSKARVDDNVRRLGRPPATDSIETRRKILETARREFAVHGYEVTTNRRIAAEVGITPAALYHYFPSKLDLYVAVRDYTEDAVATRFRDVTATAGTLVDRLSIVLEESHRMNSEDPSLAQFLGAFRIDQRRHPELATTIANHPQPLADFIVGMVDDAVSNGEVDRSDRQTILSSITILLVGLSDAMSDDLRAHRRGIDASRVLLAGGLPVRRRS